MTRLTSARRAQSGQALVEFALVIPVFFLALVGIFDVGRMVYTNSALSQAAREGARLAATEAAWVGVTAPSCVSSASAIGPGNPGAHVCPATVANLRAHVGEAVNRMAVSLGTLSAVHISCNEGSSLDPAPSGDWTDQPGGLGNGCQTLAGTAVGTDGDLISVRVEYTYSPVTPIIGSLIGSVPLSGSATMVIN